MKKKTGETAVSLPLTEEFYHVLFEKTDQGFCLLEKLSDQQQQLSDYKYLKINPAFERHTGLQNVIGKTIRELIPGAASTIEHYNHVVHTGQRVYFEEYVHELDLWIEAEVFPTGLPNTVAVLFTNVSEQKRTKAALQQSEERWAAVERTQVEAALQKSEERQAFMLKLSDALREVAAPVEVQGIASRLLGEYLDANQVIVDGNIVAAVAINTDITEQWQLAVALKESEERFRSFVMASSDLVFRVSPDWQEMRILKNDKFLPDVEPTSSNWMANYIPQQEHKRVRVAINEAIAQKKMFDLEHQIIVDHDLRAWVHSQALPVLNFQGEIIEWRGAASDITLRKKAEQQLQDYNEQLQQEVSERIAELQASKNQLQSILDTTLVQMSFLESIRDENGIITDFEIKLVNKELEKGTGRTDLVGKRYSQEYFGIRQTGLFDLIVKTIETGENQQTEYYYHYEGFNHWFSCMFIKLGDGVVATNMDITARKQAEEERFKNYLLLQQSEDMALLGSWEYEIFNGVFTWSDGMYRLFNLNKETEIKPKIYLQYTTEAGRPAAERVVKHISQGDSDFEETVEIELDSQIKVLHLKATVVRNQEGHPVRVLGVDMDVTAMRAAEEQMRKMEAEQQLEIFRVSLSTLEDERQRISESLHNGLGQLLYGIKINFSGLSQTMDQTIFKDSKSYTNQLLTDAIRESRRISHELMPTILEDFGLKSAIEDICQQMQSGIKLTCVIKGFSTRLDKYLELAVYRTVQELMTNVVKHAQATEATAEVTASPKEIKIRISDNGRGMEASKSGRPGIGLASIRSKIKLLNGTVSIGSEASSGTIVEVVIPQYKLQLLP